MPAHQKMRRQLISRNLNQRVSGLLTAAAVVTAIVASTVVGIGNTAVATSAVASEMDDKQSDYNKPDSRILKPIAQTVHLCASFIL